MTQRDEDLIRGYAERYDSEIQKELDLLHDIMNPDAYRLGLAERLLQRGMDIVMRERPSGNPYQQPPRQRPDRPRA
jgi:hypothetical protein